MGERVTWLAQPPAEELDTLTVLQALADPVRLQIVRELGRRDTGSCGSFDLGVAKSTVSHHLKVLREAGLIRTRLDGVNRVSELRRDDVERRFPGLLPGVLSEATGGDGRHVRP